jgi:tRNA/tmRNA/rRNA uracil-C5-methylase (TrmA/RlmC/RlmD family)
VEQATCPHRPPCPGCPRFGELGVGLAARAALADLSRAHGLPEPAVICGSTAGFRLRARLAVRGRLGSPKLGLFEEGTHRVVHIPNCSVHHPLINRVASVVRRALVDAQVTCYSDRAHLGLVRHLQVVVERSSQTAQVVLVANCPTPDPLAACLDLIRERLGQDLHSLWFNANQQPTNVILGPRFQHWHGPASVVEHFGGAAIHYPPGAFGQSNLDIAQRIIEHLRGQIPADSKVVEFYAGVGAIGLSLLDLASELRMNEVSPHSLEGLQLGLAELEPSSRSKVSIIPGEAGTQSSQAAGADVVIVDPPRKGLDLSLSAFLGEQPPARLLYVSCGLESLLKDVERLTSRGTLRLASLTALNLLPFTEHVETVASFERG